ncbi:hypothetical protein QLQ12_20495 [Actinoplanes sp. NEAU-A12]|uniref:Uncharacterized protein n=1 Tax=Actinoplanes sandaracinus TaxID=3045177 RepID=A0ABT6WMT0_9ACTN|nr:hypothetical protein [Actinoplanes sandaracinus]MDI6100996.1 hypothetical protein [Actinoplanes sandaracinus]
MGDLFTDMRGGDRRMRVSYHEGRGAVVVSLWADTVCRGTFQLAVTDVPRLVALLSHVERSAGTTSMPGHHDDLTDAVTPQPVTPSPEQTGDVHRTALPTVRTPRVA